MKLKYIIYNLIGSLNKESSIARGNNYKELKVLKLKFETLKNIIERENKRNATVETKASMFIGVTSIMGAIVVGCFNLISDLSHCGLYFGMCMSFFLLAIVYNLTLSIVCSISALRRRVFMTVGIDDLKEINSTREYYIKFIEKNITIIRYNQGIINQKVDEMSNAQEFFLCFWLWSFIYVINVLFHSLLINLNFDDVTQMICCCVLTILFSSAGYILLKELSIERTKNVELDKKNISEEVNSVMFFSYSK